MTVLPEVILDALREKRDRLSQHNQTAAHRFDQILDEFASLPVLDSRSPDQILGYDETGAFGGR